MMASEPKCYLCGNQWPVADDEEAVTIEWIREIGLDARNVRSGDQWLPNVLAQASTIWLRPGVTRGDVRRLAAAIGILLGESKP